MKDEGASGKGVSVNFCHWEGFPEEGRLLPYRRKKARSGKVKHRGNGMAGNGMAKRP